MGKHACRKAGRCALSLLYGLAVREATPSLIIPWAAKPALPRQANSFEAELDLERGALHGI
jgi:hypothetical protein